MIRSKSEIGAVVRWVALFLSIALILLGACLIYDGYVPERPTRFGLAGALVGTKAKEFGFIVVMLASLPLLLWCRSARQAALLGTIAGTLLLFTIFATVYT